MYEQFFGLKTPPFHAKPVGNAVFVGPQTARTMAGFRKALASQDAVVTVSGPVGTGKTTLVERSVDAMGCKYKTIRVGRMKMDSNDVLEALLVVLGVKDRPEGTIQRFATLRRTLKELEDREVRVFILVEDALRTGTETLAELEALTAADAGESNGASIVVMGDERLLEFMQSPQLGQLQQRIRQRHTTLPYNEAELRGYLTHSFRLAGAEFDAIFDARCPALLRELSGGIPRVVNNIVESVLTSAASKSIDKISATYIATVASDEYGLTVEDFDFSVPAASAPVEDRAPTENVAPAEAPPVAAEPAIVEPAPTTPVNDPEPVTSVAEEATTNNDAPSESEDSPHLIQDTLPDLAILAPEIVSPAAEAEAEAAIPKLEPLPEPEPQPEPEPEPEPELEAAPEPVAQDIPSLEPLLEPEKMIEATPEIIPELEPLLAPEPEPATEPEFENEPLLEEEPILEKEPELEQEPVLEKEAVLATEPELTAEPELSAEPIAEPAAEELPKLELEIESNPSPTPVGDTVLDAEDTPESGQHAADDAVASERDPTLAEMKPDLDALEKAMALAHGEAVDVAETEDKPAEKLSDSVSERDEIPEITLDASIETGIEDLSNDEPGDIQKPKRAKPSEAELGRIAAELSTSKSLEDMDDKMAETLFGTEISMIAAQIIANPPVDDSANDEIQLELEKTGQLAASDGAAVADSEIQPATDAAPVAEEIKLETVAPAAPGSLAVGATQRLKTVRSLNAKSRTPSQNPKPSQDANNGSAAAGQEPVPIEDQINTSITQTLKALKMPHDMPDDEPEEEDKKKGFFSRFRRS